MSQKHQELERGEGKGGDGNVIWDMGSALYDSYELASLCQILDRHLTYLPFHGESLQEGPTGAPPMEEKKQVALFRAHRGRSNKVTLKALFRAMASWVIRPRQAYACGCVGAASSGAVGRVVPHGKV